MTTNILIAPGVTLRAMQSDKFKTGCFSINFLRQHNKENASIDALLPSVLLRGTEKYPDMQQITARLDELYGSAVGTLVRCKGEAKLFGFYAEFLEDQFVPEGGIFTGILDFLDQLLYHPYTEDSCFCHRYVEGEKRNLINALEAVINDKRSYATRRLLHHMCPEEDYRIHRLGSVEDVEKITARDLWEHYQYVLRNCSIEIFYGGRLTPQEAAAAFAPMFAHRKDAPWEETHTKLVPVASQVREISESMKVSQGKLVMGLRIDLDPTDPEYVAMNLLNGILGVGMTSKLFTNVREKRSLCYYASSTYNRFKGIMFISAGIDFEDYEVAKDAILAELEACKRGDITPEELESARIQHLSALYAALDAPNRLDDFFVGQAISPTVDLPQQIEMIKALTVQELAAVANKLTLDTVYFLKGVEE